MKTKKHWDIDAAKQHYRISDWGIGLYDVNKAGHVVSAAGDIELDLYSLYEYLESIGIKLPILVRFPHVLGRFLDNLNHAFNNAMLSEGYQGKYVSAYPIKVNQQSSVIQYFHDQNEWPIAFEVGSKAELVACLGILKKNEQVIICNGYKDKAYIRLALLGSMLGHDVIIVLEGVVDLQHVLDLARELKILPKLGMRVRLSSIAEGNWQNTGGQRSKFGLTTNEVLTLIECLKENDAVNFMEMLHFHMGSQIPSLRDIKSGITEGMQFYTELSNMGVKFNKLNIGGGLAVDYEGSCTSSYFSTDYTINEYASSIVNIVHTACKKYGIKEPVLYSENGRAMTAYHAVLLTNVIDAEFECNIEKLGTSILSGIEREKNIKLKNLIALYEKITLCSKNKSHTKDLSCFYLEFKEEISKLEKYFAQGLISLKQKALVENITEKIYRLLLDQYCKLSANHKEEVEEKLINKYFCNFSLFQSTPDIWGIGQIFPIMPIHLLNVAPTCKVRIQDLTCDSDGQINRYVEDGSINSYLSLHDVREHEKYILGLFLVGAYQEILGDMHNLFGDTNAVNIGVNPDGSYQIYEEEPGDTVEEILSYVHIDITKMRQNLSEKLDGMEVSQHTREYILKELNAALKSNSYLS